MGEKMKKFVGEESGSPESPKVGKKNIRVKTTALLKGDLARAKMQYVNVE